MNVKLGIYSLIVLGILNLVLLDSFLLFGQDKRFEDLVAKRLEKLPASQTTPVSEGFPSDICPAACLSQISQATSSIKLEKPSPIPVSQPQVSVSSAPRESVIAFGSGTNSTDDWADVSGLQTYIDSSKYGKIKSVAFEAYVRIPTGNQTAYVRLFNVTDKHPVWFSDVSLEGGTPKLLISKPITLDSGSKLYQVQMKTSLKFQAILDQARVRITSD